MELTNQPNQVKMKLLRISTFLLLSIIIPIARAGDTVKIMPVGNSITAGEHYGFPAVEERTGYRKALYDMLTDNGYHVDFVGSQNHGMRPEDTDGWFDWNCEAYPGWKIPAIAERVEVALPKYNPDILLAHVGTNGRDWGDKPAQVNHMLDIINEYSVEADHSVTVLLSLIINRYNGGHAASTQFNRELAKKVAARTGDKIKILLVDMETGAGLDYSDKPPDPDAVPPYAGGDMWGETYKGVAYDKYHPNDKGNKKMAIKYYEKLVKVLPEPSACK